VPDGRIGVSVVSENRDKNYTLSQFELTREDLQVCASMTALLFLYLYISNAMHWTQYKNINKYKIKSR